MGRVKHTSYKTGDRAKWEDEIWRTCMEKITGNSTMIEMLTFNYSRRDVWQIQGMGKAVHHLYQHLQGSVQDGHSIF